MHRIALPAPTVDIAATNDWLAENAKGIVLSTAQVWRDFSESHGNNGLGSWNHYAFKLEPGRHFPNRDLTEDERDAKNFVTWEFWEKNDAMAFQKRWGGEYSVR